jgi:hypothetical protein
MFAGSTEAYPHDDLVINKIDLASQVGASLEVMRHDAEAMRPGKPTIFTNCPTGAGVDDLGSLLGQPVCAHTAGMREGVGRATASVCARHPRCRRGREPASRLRWRLGRVIGDGSGRVGVALQRAWQAARALILGVGVPGIHKLKYGTELRGLRDNDRRSR